MQASGASELRKFWHFCILKVTSFNILSVIQILCRYKWHACRLVHVPTNSQMYQQNSEKALLGGGGAIAPPPPPPPPPLTTLVGLSALEVGSHLGFAHVQVKIIRPNHVKVADISKRKEPLCNFCHEYSFNFHNYAHWHHVIFEEFHRKTRYIHFGQFEIFEI